jgi:hypothetical protein
MKFRPQRGSLKESMAEVVEVSTRAELLSVLRKLYAPVPVTRFEIRYYCYDARIDWETYLVTIPENVAVGYTDGPLEVIS